MSTLHVRQIRAALEKLLASDVDVSDLATRPKAEQEVGFLTRALAAYALVYLGGVSPTDAGAAITDGFGDNGIDAVYYHAPERILYIVQSKWRQDGNGSIDRAEIQKFLKGFRDLINARWTRFNPKLKKRAADIEAALTDAATRIRLIVIHTGRDPIAAEIDQDIKDVLDELNDPTELATAQVLRLVDVYSAISQGAAGGPIDVELALYDWGQVREPYSAFYGQVSASDVAAWYVKYQSQLFAPNIRVFLGTTDVNTGIAETLTGRPDDFWYFNNGITALCRTIAKKPIGGSSKETGLFECHDLRIVNGAQTVGAIANAAQRDPSNVAKARVAIRLISLDQCPPEFEKDVTRFNNTQNRIDRRDFVALDPHQERIKGELQLEGVTYAFKSGDAVPSTDTGFDLVEATVARACQQGDVSVAVQAKREIGKLWEDIDKAPYKLLFNATVPGPTLWRGVQIVRVVEDELASVRSDADGRRRLLAVHGNRFIEHLVMRCLPQGFLADHRPLDDAARQTVRSLTRQAFDRLEPLLQEHYSDAYLASLFKNASKCQQLKAMFSCP